MFDILLTTFFFLKLNGHAVTNYSQHGISTGARADVDRPSHMQISNNHERSANNSMTSGRGSGAIASGQQYGTCSIASRGNGKGRGGARDRPWANENGPLSGIGVEWFGILKFNDFYSKWIRNGKLYTFYLNLF